MLVEIKWHNIANRTIYCLIEGEWSYSGYNHAYMQLVHHARQVPDKINLILDVSNVSGLIEDAALLCVSPFIHHAVIVTEKPKQSVVRQLQHLLHAQNPEIIFSHTNDVPLATAKIRHEFVVRA